MSQTLTKLVVDCSTGEQAYVPLTKAEVDALELAAAQAKADQEAREAEEAAKEALKVSARQKLVAGEPLTPEEAALLVL